MLLVRLLRHLPRLDVSHHVNMAHSAEDSALAAEMPFPAAGTLPKNETNVRVWGSVSAAIGVLTLQRGCPIRRCPF